VRQDWKFGSIFEPANPDQIYLAVWKGLNDFLGTRKPRNIGRTWRAENFGVEVSF
jgi:hypothetical protein